MTDIKAELYSVDGYQGSCMVRSHTRYIIWDIRDDAWTEITHLYAREGESHRFIMQDAVARMDELLPEPRPR